MTTAPRKYRFFTKLSLRTALIALAILAAGCAGLGNAIRLKQLEREALALLRSQNEGCNRDTPEFSPNE